LKSFNFDGAQTSFTQTIEPIFNEKYVPYNIPIKYLIDEDFAFISGR